MHVVTVILNQFLDFIKIIRSCVHAMYEQKCLSEISCIERQKTVLITKS